MEDLKNPPAVVDAFAEGAGIRVGNLTIRPFTISSFIVLQKMDHPVLRLAGRGGARKSAMSNLDVLRLLHVLTRPGRASLEALERGDLDAEALALGDTVPLGDLPQIGEAIAETLSRAMRTVGPAVTRADGKKKGP